MQTDAIHPPKLRETKTYAPGNIYETWEQDVLYKIDHHDYYQHRHRSDSHDQPDALLCQVNPM